MKCPSFIVNILMESVKMVGSANVVQVVTDNAKNCRAVGAIAEATYNHVLWIPRTTQSLNLIMQKISIQIEWVSKNYTKAEQIQMFVTNYHMTQAIFKIFSSLELLKVI